jgi:hypothetical protein
LEGVAGTELGALGEDLGAVLGEDLGEVLGVFLGLVFFGVLPLGEVFLEVDFLGEEFVAPLRLEGDLARLEPVDFLAVDFLDVARDAVCLLGLAPADFLGVVLVLAPRTLNLPEVALLGPERDAVDLPEVTLLGVARDDVDLPEVDLLGPERDAVDLPAVALLGVARDDVDLPEVALLGPERDAVDLPGVALLGVAREAVDLAEGLETDDGRLALPPLIECLDKPEGRETETRLTGALLIPPTRAISDKTSAKIVSCRNWFFDV